MRHDPDEPSSDFWAFHDAHAWPHSVGSDVGHGNARLGGSARRGRWSTRKPLLGIAVMVMALAGGTILWPRAEASPIPNAQFGAVACAGTATLVPTTSLNGREGIIIRNMGPNTIYVGLTTAATCAAAGLTSSTGFPVFANEIYTAAATYTKATDALKLCCLSPTPQVSPADTRYQELL